MQFAATVTSNPARRFAPSPVMLALSLTVVITALRANGSVDSDVAWQLWIAGRLHAGAHLYRDILEVNPPLWFWMARPVDALARFFTISPQAVLVILMGALVGLALTATDRLVLDMPGSRRRLLLCYSALALMAVPWVHVGQREQIVLIATLPYAALLAGRVQGKEIAPSFAAAIGAGAALGFALKHYFLLAPAFLELWLLVCSGSRWKLLRPETLAMAIVGAIYACAALFWASAYLTNVLPLVLLAYSALGASRTIDLFGSSALLGLLFVGVLATQWRLLATRKAPFAAALTVCAAAFAVAYFIQSKGWPYQAIPFVGCASLSLASILAEIPSSPKLLRIVSPALLALPLAAATQEKLRADAPRMVVFDAVNGLKSGDSVGFLATDNAIAWSVMLQRDFRYPSRYMSFWMMNAIVRNESLGNPNPELADLGRKIVSQTVEDFRCAPPQRLIVSRPKPGEQGFDILAFFLRDRQFAKMMANYKPRDWAALQTFDRVRPLDRPDVTCRSGV